MRRDFTVNAIALALTGPARGRLQAAPGAIDDLRRGLLSVLHDHSFEDDPTRLVRLARYRARLGFAITPDTLALAPPRIGNELRAVMREEDPVAAFAALDELGIDAAIDAGLGLSEDDRPLAARALELLPGDGRADLETLAVAARRMSVKALAELLDRLAFEAADRDVVVIAATCSEALARRLASARRPSEIWAAVAGGGVELVALAGALGASAPAQAWIERLRYVALKIDGGDLIAAGLGQGPAVGAGLRAALAAALDGEADGRERQLEIALRAARRTG